MNPEWRSRYELAIEAARAGGNFARRIYDDTFADRNLQVIQKSDNSPVTVADRGAEELIRGMVSRHFSGDGFLGEEFGDQPGTSGFRWIIDPIDGTKSFIRHIPIWGTLIGLEYNGEQIAGAVYVPVFDQMYRALRGDGAYLDHQRIRVSGVSELSDAMLCYSGMNWFTRAGRQQTFQNLYNQTWRQRGYGDFYGFLLVAQGSCEIMLEHGVNPWDIAATKAIVEEAGGKFTDWDGGDTIHRPDVLATNGVIHAKALALLGT